MVDEPMVSFYYLDQEGIDSLFAQVGKPYVETIVRRKTSGTTRKASGKISTGLVLKWLGIGEVGADVGLNHGRTYSEEFTEFLRTEHKLRIAMNAVSEGKALIVFNEDTFDAEDFQAEDFQKALFVDFSGHFETQSFCDAISLRKRNHTDQFVTFRCRHAPITMGTSLRKYETGLSHLAIAWGRGEAELRIFGVLTPTGRGEFYLKPFAVSAIH